MAKSRHDQFLKQLQNLNVWKRGDQRAPHKPLLLLWYLGHVQRGGERLVPFSELCEPLREMLIEYGPPRKSFHPEYPFWRLQNDGIWEVHAPVELRRRKGNTDVPQNELLKHNAVGGLSEPFYKALRENPLELNRAAELLLESNFPGSLHDEIAARVGVMLARSFYPRLKRDASFRQRVLQSYDNRCSVCGFNARLGTVSIGLEAAHVKWHQAGGPDAVENGLALCTLHHKALDRGAITISFEHKILISADLNGSVFFDEMFLRLQGQRLAPSDETLLPHNEFLRWHHREVFRKPDRGRGLV